MSAKQRRPRKQGPPRTSDTKDLIVLVVTQSSEQEDSVQFGARAYGAEHNLTNEELLGLIGMLSAAIIMPIIEEHGYDPDFIPTAIGMIEKGMGDAFKGRLDGLIHMDKKRIILEN